MTYERPKLSSNSKTLAELVIQRDVGISTDDIRQRLESLLVTTQNLNTTEGLFAEDVAEGRRGSTEEPVEEPKDVGLATSPSSSPPDPGDTHQSQRREQPRLRLRHRKLQISKVTDVATGKIKRKHHFTSRPQRNI